MININQTSEQTKILIPRSNINGDIEKDNYVTEDELQEILKEYNSIPYIVVDGFSHSSFEITKGNWDAVNNAIQNNEPYLIYARSSNTAKVFSLVDDIFPLSNGDVSIATTLIVTKGNVTYRTWTIDIDGNVELELEEKYTIQHKLVSGENIKTINGNDILGEGDIIIESGNGNIVELTQSEYDNITPEENTLYVISDAPAVEIPDTSIFVDKETLTYEIDAINISLSQKQDTLVSGVNIKTINGESIIGEGDIKVEGSVDLTGYATEQWVDDKGYLKEIPEEYVTDIELAYKNYVDTSYLNDALGGYAKLSYVNEQIGNINNVLENIIG